MIRRLSLTLALLLVSSLTMAVPQPIRDSAYDWRCLNPDGTATNHQRQDTAIYACQTRAEQNPGETYYIEGGRYRVLVAVPDPDPVPVDCAGAWSPWSRVAGSESACVDSQRTFSESRAFTVTTPPASGGAACPASPETRTASEACTMPPPPPPVAGNKWVTPSGTGDCSQSSPCSATQAFTSARAGDVVVFAPGRYEAPDRNDSLAPAFRPSADGTAQSKITFRAQYPAATEADPARWSQLVRTGGTRSPVVGAGGSGAYRSHIVFDGFYLDYNDGAYPTPRGVVYVGFNNQGVEVRRFRIQRANLGAADDGDNYNCIQIHGSTGTVIADNLFLGGYDAGGSHNESCITTYGARDFVIEHNQFDGVTAAIYIKGSFAGTGNAGVVRFNRFSDFRYGIELTESTGQVLVTQNIFEGGDAASYYSAVNYENSVGAQNRNMIVERNTIIAPALSGGGNSLGPVGLEPGVNMSGNVFRGNIVATSSGNTQVLVNAYQVPNLSPFAEWDGNLYWNGGVTPRFAVGSQAVSGLSAWRSASGRDASAVVQDPGFTDGDYRGPTSHGAYISGSEVIGIR